MSSKKTLDQRVQEKEAQLNEFLKKAKQYEAQLKMLQAKQKEENRKARNHRLIEIGASIESVLDHPVEKEMLPSLISWLKEVEKTDMALSNALGLEVPEMEQYIENIPLPEE